MSKADLRAEIGQLREEKRKSQAMVDMLKSEKRYSIALAYLRGNNSPTSPGASSALPVDSDPMAVDRVPDKGESDHDSLQHSSPQDILSTEGGSTTTDQVSLLSEQVSPMTDSISPASGQYTGAWDTTTTCSNSGTLDAFGPTVHSTVLPSSCGWDDPNRPLVVAGQAWPESNPSSASVSVSAPDALLPTPQCDPGPFALEGRGSGNASQIKIPHMVQSLPGSMAFLPAYSDWQVSPGGIQANSAPSQGARPARRFTRWEYITC
jgi:hypothetical protein